jgi:ParB-like chromosome segregation protein Spo0J
MIAAAPLREVPLAAIDLEDQTFLFSDPGDHSQLEASLKEAGMLNPPWLRGGPGERFQPVTGRKRLRAAARLGWELVPARVLPWDAPEASCLLLHLHDNAWARPFNPLEQALLAKSLEKIWERQTVAARFLPLLGLPPSLALLERLLALARLEEPLRQLAARGRLSLPGAAVLASWRPEDRTAAVSFLEKLPWSHSKQEEFLQGINLLARRENRSPEEILSREELQGHLTGKGATPQVQAAAARDLLQKWVSPRFSAARETFQKGLRRLGLMSHPRLRLQPPPALEGPDFHLEIKFKDAEELQHLLVDLLLLSREEDFEALTRI